MPACNLNRFNAGLGQICRDNPLNEKWLLAPSLRTGFQWLDAVTRAGQPVLNVRVKTLQHAALDLAMPELDHRGSTYLGRLRAELLVSSIFVKRRQAGQGYFTVLEPSTGLIQALLSTIGDIRLSGLKATDLSPEVFEVHEKGLETKEILGQYEEELDRKGLADLADVLRIAAIRLEKVPSVILPDTLILVPETLWNNTAHLEKRLLEAFPANNRSILSEDPIGTVPEDDPTDRALLGAILTPANCPTPKFDDTGSIYRAIGEVNEVREVFRRCADGKISFDEVEILHTDGAAYVPLIYELAWALRSEEAESIPVTFAEGIPTSYSRPGRALRAWLSWMRNDHPQWTLVRMIQDGILRIDKAEEDGLSFSLLAAALKGVPIGAGAQRYLQVIDGQIQALDQPPPEDESDEDPAPKGSKKHAKTIKSLREIRSVVVSLLEKSLRRDSSQKEVLETAGWFLENCSRCANELDAYSKGRLQAEIRELASSMELDDNYPGFDVWEWLSMLPSFLSVAGSGPRPGCMHVAPVRGGGHAGRSNTFILGLDDTRFPGTGLQDPLLLDGERGKISSNLSISSGRVKKKMDDFARLLARLRGALTLSYCCKSLDDDREMFPSPLLMSAFRILSGKLDGDQDAFVQWLPEPTSFAAQRPEQCTNMSEWWLWRTCGDKGIIAPDSLVSASFPHLGQGMVAFSQRQSDVFTEYDGWVPQAGIDLDPTSPNGPTLSPSRMEKLASCPMEYFFKYVLRVEPHEEYQVDPSVWLDPLQQGGLLHSVFHDFMTALKKNGLRPDVDRDSGLMSDILERHIESYRNAMPPPNEEIFNMTVHDLRMVTKIFLQEETVFCRSSIPLYFEAAIGLPQNADPTDLDTPDSVWINLPGGISIKTRGKIDRIDQVPNAKGDVFTVWDYKTGSAWGYDRNNPFRDGRRIQNVFYWAMAQNRLREVHSSSSSVALFGYFFPGVREHGERISWNSHQLIEGKEVIAGLVAILRSGCFAFTNDPKDVTFTNYGVVFGDIDDAAEACARKLENPSNTNLEPFRKLRS